MSDPRQKFYLTTPIYYVNARPHIGHAYTTIVADVLARRHRLLGDDTFFLTGTDEHGQKIERSALAAGVPPQQFADQVSAEFEKLWTRMGITHNAYIRTTDEKHKKGVQKLFATLYERGFIELRAYTGTYCVSDETFVDVPAGAPCPDCGRITEVVTEENFFFKLSEFQAPLINLIETGALKVEPETRRNEVLSFLRGNLSTATDFTTDTGIQPEAKEDAPSRPSTPGPGPSNRAYSDLGNPYVPGALKDLSISRSSFTWGIPVPEPAASAAAQKHVIYVWLDALANYMTAIGYGSDEPADAEQFQKYWPADLHLVGKEIIRFHCVYWPAFLLAAGLPLPKAITAHGWLLFDNSKMSKSKGNIVRTETILDAFGDHVYGKQFPDSTKAERDLFASDVLRYFLLREIPFGQDGSFSFDALITRYNADLANGYGNLVSRTFSLIQQNQNGTITAAAKPWLCLNEELSRTQDTIKVLKIGTKEIIQAIKSLVSGSGSIRDFVVPNLTSILALNIGKVDFYLSSHAPWKLAKSDDPSDRQRMDETLYTAAESLRIITILLHPFMPFATAKVWQQLGLGDTPLTTKNSELTTLSWGGLKPGTKLGPLAPIFPRADKGLTQIMTDMENPLESQNSNLETDSTKPAAGSREPGAESPTTRPESPLKSSSTPTPAEPITTNTFDPAAPPRTSALEDPTASTQVAGSATLTTERPTTPSHTEAPASGIFAQHPATEATPQITIDDFAKVELRVAEIKVAERIPKADKLLRLEVDLGPEFPPRQILSGIAEWYTPEELIGRRIVVITNLAPRKMRGLESHGMLLAASNGESGKPILATFSEDIALGSRLK